MASDKLPYHICADASEFVMDKLMTMAAKMHGQLSRRHDVNMLNHEEVIDGFGVPYELQIYTLNGHSLADVDEGFPDTVHIDDVYEYIGNLSKQATGACGCIITANSHTIGVVCREAASGLEYVLFDPMPAIVAEPNTKRDFEESMTQALGVMTEFSLSVFRHRS